ncbi:MAG: hypothetical protein WC340_07190 [Kiritimatiellia bacterium]
MRNTLVPVLLRQLMLGALFLPCVTLAASGAMQCSALVNPGQPSYYFDHRDPAPPSPA